MIGILFENDEIVVIDKPAGLPSQPGEGVGSTVLSVVEDELGFKPFPVHRLDKETAGCMILARDAAAASRWSILLAERNVAKVYRAVCAGGPLADKGSYSDDLVKGGKASSALTHFSCLARFGRNEGKSPAFSFLELELGSGRTHQIRRHMAMHGHPILGDDKYGNFPLNRQLKKATGLRHLLLWSYRLEIPGNPPIIASRPRHFTDFLGHWSDFPGMEVL